MNRLRPTFVRCVVLGCVLCACRAFGPTIPQREDTERLEAGRVPLSIEEEFPDPAGDLGMGEPLDVEPVAASYVAPTIGSSELLQVEFRGAPLSQVLHFLSARAGINLFLDASIDAVVDVSFPSITLDGAMQAVLKHNGLRLVEDPPGVFQQRRGVGNSCEKKTVVLGETWPFLSIAHQPFWLFVFDPAEE